MSIKIIPYPIFNDLFCDSFVSKMEQKISALLSPNIQQQIQKKSGALLLESSPIFRASPAAGSLEVSFICPGEYTNGVARYVDDTLSRWLIPGKNLCVAAGARLTFAFATFPTQLFFFGSTMFHIESESDREIAEQNLPPLIEEIRLTIQAVYRARYIVALKHLDSEQKQLMIQESLHRILGVNPQESDQSLLDHLHGFFLKLNREEKIVQIQQVIAQLTRTRRRIFDREMFSEMTYFTVLLKDQFASRRQAWYISRIIALHYLFKKMLLNAVQKAPQERHVRFKIYKTKMNAKQPILGILLGMNILRESEGFDQRFLFNAIRTCIPNCEVVKDSYLSDRREKKVYLFYIEIYKPQFAPFRLEEITALRKKLAQEAKKQIESDMHFIFLPRNEEEVARNLIVLSQQLKYNRDLPQVSIQYEKQSQAELFFSIMIARLLLPRSKGLRELLLKKQNHLKFTIDEIREIGKLRRKIPKETAVLRVCLDKTPFLRANYSVDLLRARQKVAYELGRMIGEFRDFNGGIILKQEESLLALRQQIGSMTQETEFVLEDYFYSLRPGIMQTVLPTQILKSHFSLFEQCKISTETTLAACQTDPFYLFFSKSKHSDFKTRVEIAIDRLKFPSYELTSCFLQFPPYNYLGYILRTDQVEKATLLKNAIEQTNKEISDSINCNSPFCVVENTG